MPDTEISERPVITFEEARARIEAVACERPDYVNATKSDEGYWNACVYFNPDDTPSCIVGTAFAAELRAAGISSESDENDGIGVFGLADHGVLVLTDKALRYLEVVQGHQDGGEAWAEAAAEAAEETEDLDEATYLHPNRV